MTVIDASASALRRSSAQVCPAMPFPRMTYLRVMASALPIHGEGRGVGPSESWQMPSPFMGRGEGWGPPSHGKCPPHSWGGARGGALRVMASALPIHGEVGWRGRGVSKRQCVDVGAVFGIREI